MSAVLLVVAACGGGNSGQDPARETADGLSVVATTTVLGDITENVACGAANVDTLISPGQDPHAFELSARQAVDLSDADLVVANGLGLEQGFLDVLLEARDTGTRVLFVGDDVDPIAYGGSSDHADEDGVELVTFDPHVWMDPLRMADGARTIGADLATLAPGEAESLCSDAYAEELEELDTEVVTTLASIPSASRKLVTNHEALGYFAERYDFELVGVVIPSGSTLAEPSANDIVELVDAIERENVRAIFAESTANPNLAETVASETGRYVEIVSLYTGSLGDEDSGAATYVELIRTNAERIAGALSS